MTETTTESFWARCGGATPRDRRNMTRLLLTLFAWAVLFVGVSQAIKRELLPVGPISWALAAVPTVAGIFVLFAYGRFIREADELQRLIQLRALALGFGAGWIAICGYPLFEKLGAPVLDVGDYTLVMAVFYSLGSVLGWRRYL